MSASTPGATAKIRASEQALARELVVVSSGAPPGERRAAVLAAAEAWSADVWREAEAAGALVPSPEQIARGSALAARPVFLCGVHRSGTTLLRDLLDGHPDLCALPSEGTFLTSLAKRLHQLPREQWCGFMTREWLRRLANLNQGPFWCLGRSTEHVDPYLEYARRVLGWWPVLRETLGGNPLWPHLAIVLAYDAARPRAAGADPRYWADKTPTNEIHMAKLLEALPAARMIQMIRNPRAVVASRRALEERWRGRFVRADRALGELAASMRVALEAESRPTVHLVVRYEDLVSNPAAELGRIADFLDITPHPMLHRTTVAGQPSRSNSSFGVQAEPGEIHAGDAAGRNVSELDERLVAAYLGRSTALLGYENVAIGNLTAILTRLRTRCTALGDVLRG